jgi:hypothetical protein
MKPAPFLLVTAVVEVAAGIVLLVVPDVLLRFLLGMAQLPADVLLVARWVGVALLAIGVASGMARNDRGGAAMRGVLVAVLVYNVGAVALFVYAAVELRMPGLLLWPAVALHAVLAVWGALCLNAATATGDRG